MTNILEGHITRTPDEIKHFSTEELTTKMYNSMLNYTELKTHILEFNEYFQYTTFYKSLTFEFETAIMKHCSPADRIKWEKSMNIPWIMNVADNDPYSVKINCIIQDYVCAESKQSMKRIMTIRDITTPDGKILKDRPVFDYSLVDPNDQFDNYKWILFEPINRDIIRHYYQAYSFYFPVTLAEFERIFFFFLTFSAAKQYPSYTELNEINSFVKVINEVVRMRYFDINDRLLMSFINIIQTDPEIQITSKNIYEEIKEVNELTKSQVFGVGS